MNMPRESGYSGTPLAKKLGFNEHLVVCARGAPGNYLELLRPLPTGVEFVGRLSNRIDIVHLFATKSSALARELAQCRRLLRPDSVVWVSWPKKSSGVPTDTTEDVIRSLAIPLGFVDIKVCAVSEVWSGLKLVVRKSLRP